jgi:hypothetical protein
MWSPLPLHIQGADVVFLLIAFAFISSKDVRRLSITRLDLFVVLYVGGLLISLIGLSSLVRPLSELAKTGYLIAVYFVFGAIARNAETKGQIVASIALTTVAICGVGLLYAAADAVLQLPPTSLSWHMSLPYLGTVPRLMLGFVTPELFGEYLTSAFPFVLGVFLCRGSGKPAARAIAAISSVIAAEFLTFTHSWVGFLVAGLAFCWHQWDTRPWVRLRHWLAAAACILLLVTNAASVAYVHDVSLERRSMPRSSVPLPGDVMETDRWPQLRVTATYNYMYYFVLKIVAWDAFRGHPVNGLGLGRFDEATERAYANGTMSASCRGCMPHSTWLGHLAETGIVGGIGLIAFWVAVVVVARRVIAGAALDRDQWVTRAALAGLVGLLVNSINADVMHFRFLWVSLALIRAGALGEGSAKAWPHPESRTDSPRG